MAATIPGMSRTVSLGPMSENSLPSQNQRSQSVVSIELLNEKGEYDMVEIDEADDDVLQDSVDSRLGLRDASSDQEMRVRRQSIADRVNRRRNTEFAFEFTRVEAAGREKEFFRLLEEHSRLVHSVQFWSTAAAMQDDAQKFAMKLQLDAQQPAHPE
ncbi:hypothetical protein ECG_06365 [Echinococcus granulosus]|uniref:Expressed conserved protein n=1 Tax=Echinococcus granulosus TaxID=6210 RepID=U6JAR5_ECHGR|nr:hypothetical protein EGR_01168 [Echinococcus granulosus]EUB64040.1 hypothetical protein EGR_01168 [Echinococcus granulosus]KAH9280367.1 hypothetical protein ECG_06365 [Echinococcus granulosus]CDS19546.1 expressed conserved protein [Echinococcus granulosus]